MSEWIHVAAVEECPPGTCIERIADGHVVALYCVDDNFYALNGVCPHQGGPLGKGALNGCVVTCPWHGWQFDVRDGQSQLSQSIRQDSISVKVENGNVYVDLEEVC